GDAGARDAAGDREGAADRLVIERPVRRAVVVVTGSELVRGDRQDLNGPFLARELGSLGLEPERIVIVGDSPAELEAALREGASADLCVVSGGLGPTHDDRTVELVALVTGRELVLDPRLQREIETVSRGIAERRGLRFYGASESEVARTLREAGGEGEGVDVTVCARDFEIHVDLVAAHGARGRSDELAEALRQGLGAYLFAEDERPVAELVLDLCRERGFTLATAESCTGGLVAARLTAIPGSSDAFVGAVVAYADAVKADELGGSADLPARHGAVSDST